MYDIICYICVVIITLKRNKMKTISNIRAEKIARNINAMDMNYEYSDDMRAWKFWSELRKKLVDILASLTNEDKTLIASLCNTDKNKYFNLV